MDFKGCAQGLATFKYLVLPHKNLPNPLKVRRHESTPACLCFNVLHHKVVQFGADSLIRSALLASSALTSPLSFINTWERETRERNCEKKKRQTEKG